MGLEVSVFWLDLFVSFFDFLFVFVLFFRKVRCFAQRERERERDLILKERERIDRTPCLRSLEPATILELVRSLSSLSLFLSLTLSLSVCCQLWQCKALERETRRFRGR